MLQAKKIWYDLKSGLYKPIKPEDIITVLDNDIEQIWEEYTPFVSKNNNLLCIDIDVKGVNHKSFSKTESNYSIFQEILGIEDNLGEHYVEDSRSFGLHLFFLVPDGLINVDKLKTTNCKTIINNKEYIYTTEIFYKTNRIIFSTSCQMYKNIKPIKRMDTTVKEITQEQVNYLIDFLDNNRYKQETPTKINYNHIPNKLVYNTERIKFILDFYIEYCNRNLAELLNILNTDYYNFWIDICIALYHTQISENNNKELYFYFCSSIPYDSFNKKQYDEQELSKKWNTLPYEGRKLTFATIESTFYYIFCLQNIIDDIIELQTAKKKDVIEEENFEREAIKNFESRDSLFGLIFKFLYNEDHNFYFSYFTSIFCCSLVSQYTYEFRYTDRITMLNNYTILLAPSGNGKDKYVSFVEFFAEQLENIHMLSTPATRQGFYSDLCSTIFKNNCLITDEVLSKCRSFLIAENKAEQNSFTADICILFYKHLLNGNRTKKVEDSCPKIKGTIFSHFGVGVSTNFENFDFEAGLNRYICAVQKSQEINNEYEIRKLGSESFRDRISNFLTSIKQKCINIQKSNDVNYFMELIMQCDKYIEDKEKWDLKEEEEAQKSSKYKKKQFSAENNLYLLYKPKIKVWASKKYELSYLCELSGIDINSIKNRNNFTWISSEEFLELFFEVTTKSQLLNVYTKRELEQAVRNTCVANIEKDNIPFLDLFLHKKILEKNNIALNLFFDNKLKHSTNTTLEANEMLIKLCNALANKKIDSIRRTEILHSFAWVKKKDIDILEGELEDREIIRIDKIVAKNNKISKSWHVNTENLNTFIKDKK